MDIMNIINTIIEEPLYLDATSMTGGRRERRNPPGPPSRRKSPGPPSRRKSPGHQSHQSHQSHQGPQLQDEDDPRFPCEWFLNQPVPGVEDSATAKHVQCVQQMPEDPFGKCKYGFDVCPVSCAPYYQKSCKDYNSELCATHDKLKKCEYQVVNNDWCCAHCGGDPPNFDVPYRDEREKNAYCTQ